MKKNEKEKYEKRIKELEMQIEDLQAARPSADEGSSEGSEVESTAGSVLETLGRSLGLSGLIKSVSKLPEFQERLSEIDDELRGRLDKSVFAEGFTSGRTPSRKVSGIPPGARTRQSGSKLVRTKEDSPPEPSRKVDVFDEENHLLVVCEIPGSEEDKIEVKLDKDKLSITAGTLHRQGAQFQKELVLPCVPEGKMSRSYRNGILKIKILKVKPQP